MLPYGWNSEWWEWELLFNVTCNDISVIYAKTHRCAGGFKKKLDLRSGSQRHRHFVGFLYVPVPALTQGHPFIRLFREYVPFSRLLRHTGDTEDTFSNNPPPPGGVLTGDGWINVALRKQMCSKIGSERVILNHANCVDNAIDRRSPNRYYK